MNLAVGFLPEKIRDILNSDLLGKMLLVGGTALAVKLIAFAKELLVADRFGTSDEVDAFLLVFAIPNLIAFIIGDAFHDTVLPAYARAKKTDREKATRLVANTFWICLGILLLASLLLWAASVPVLELLGSRFDSEKQMRGAELLRLLFPFAICFGTASVLKGLLHSYDRFFITSASPVLVPLATIVILLFMPEASNGNLLSFGASIGACLYLIAMIFACRYYTNIPLFRIPEINAQSRKILKDALPLMGSSAVLAGCYFIDTMMAAALEPGSVSVLNYGEKISTIVLTIGVMAVGEVLFPHLSRLAADEKWQDLKSEVKRFSLLVLVISIPAVLFFWFASLPLVRLLLERGEFTATDTVRVAGVLKFAAFQIPGYLLFEIGIRVVMALQGTRLMPVVSLVALVVNVLLNFLFMHWFGVQGIALSTAVVGAISSVICLVFFARQIAHTK